MADGIGQVNFYLSIINYISMFAGLGIPTYAIREVAKVKSDVKVMNQVAVEILLLHTFLTLLGYIVVGVVALTVAQVQVNLPLFLILSTNLFFITIGCEWFYQGIEDFKYITIRGLIVKMLSVALLFVLVKDRSDLFYYGIYSVVGVVGGNVFNAFRLRKYIKFRLLGLKELRPMRHLIPALRIFLLNIVASIYLQLDTLMLGFLKGNEAVGYYTGAIKLTKMLMGVTSSLCVVLLPRLSNLAVGNKREEFDRLLKKALDYVIVIAAPMSMGLVIMAPTLVYLFCGEGYVPSISTMQITAPIILFISISYVLVQSIFSLGKENITIITGIVGALTVIRDITIRNSAYWTIHLIGCYDALIDGISLLNNLKIRNGDGIDVDHSKKVRIANCFIESGDDCICLKNRREFEEYGSCEDIVVTNCCLLYTSRCV